MRVMGSGPGRSQSGTYGSIVGTETVLDQIGRHTLISILEPIVIKIGTVILQQLGAAIITGYCLYKFGRKLKSMKEDYDSMSGSPVSKLTVLAIREGFKIGLGKIGNKMPGTGINKLIALSVHTTGDILSRQGVFKEVVSGVGLPESYERDLRDFYTAAGQRTLEGLYSGTKDEIIDYVSRRVVP
jgi:hypothetical protein